MIFCCRLLNVLIQLGMRVISGKARGCRLVAPTGFETRPTGDRMKEDLFNILGPMVQGASFLDLYCGSGAIGIEALSRGADSAVFVDDSQAAIEAAKANLRKTGLCDSAALLYLPAARAIKHDLAGRVFDLIFLDPPYKTEELAEALCYIALGGLLADNGILLAECPLDVELPNVSELRLFRQKKYKQMQFAFFEMKGRGAG